jgi:hypothetical protein
MLSAADNELLTRTGHGTMAFADVMDARFGDAVGRAVR